jgi:hypothetical protein
MTTIQRVKLAGFKDKTIIGIERDEADSAYVVLKLRDLHTGESMPPLHICAADIFDSDGMSVDAEDIN